MTFEEWKTRPVAIVETFTFGEYKKLNLPWWWLRVVKAYRKPMFSEARKRVAENVRAMRKNGLNFRKVREIAVEKINLPSGDAERVNFEEMLDILK